MTWVDVLAGLELQRHDVDRVVVEVELEPALDAGSSEALATSTRIS